MNKKLQNGLVMAVSAAMGTGIVAPIIAAAATTGTNLDAQYAEAYNATVKATASKDQKDLTAARVLVDGLYQAVKGTKAEYLATTLSSLLDPAQQVKLNDLYAAMAKADGSLKQSDINASRDLLLAMPQQWITTFSSANDAIQQKLIAKVNAAVVTAEGSKSGLDKIAAMALVNDVKTATNNADVVAWANAMVTRVNAVVAKVAVDKVTASNTTTLTFTGSGLENLKADAITITGYTVSTVTPSADGLSATVTLTTGILPNNEYTVTVNGTDYKVTYGLVVSTVAVNPITVDNNRSGQAVTLKVNGADMDIDTLNAADYVVDFVALDKNNTDVTATVFDNSNTGDLLDALTIGDYKVYASVHKDNTVVNSDYATLKVRNLDQTATTINKFTLTNVTTGVAQVSNTLVVGETADFTNLNVTANGDTFDTKTTVTDVTSSAPGVVSVDAAGLLTANAPGTATITVAYGDVTKAITFTVTNTARELTKATASSTSFTLIKGSATGANTKDIKVNTFDQYGDPFVAQAYLMSSALIGTVSATDTAGAITIDGKIHSLASSVYVAADKAAYDTVTFNAAAKGSGQMYVCDGSGKVLTSIAVTVTDVNNVGSSRLELVKDTTDSTRSTDNTLDKFADKNVVYNLNDYTSQNIFNGSEDLGGYFVQYNPNVVTVTATAAPTVINNGLVKVALDAGTDLAITAAGTGSTDVVLYNAAGQPVTGGKVTITVTNSAPTITGVTFKTNPTIDYIGKTIKASTVLTLTTGSDDAILSGVTLSSASGHATRVVDTASASVGTTVNGVTGAIGLIYIDKNDDGLFDGSDYALGNVKEKVVSGATGLTAAIADAFAGITTASGDKGTVLFTIENLAGTKIYTSTTVSVDVK